ncbi:cyclic nucleotide-binding domain protein (macronuclear) [Tetrahymena thermophila SB210]|uniref:Cyclic nucleotide-binding domain protein n=1 Tax=Tetrahymena thermophila (strain SB210) TaxID=312017 RepID=Q23DP5_TETTS|nr:cyclic nucleotide-binding domain protein [Tetrahymena thermophila SB210]EAR94397.2 cyclic nucleotide-binding domain protein [Tetrahymena thermophila SB210]|eukprot:XP_001014641.2 cyclic nucleotide-binding domain protein [Tetrahymena thermophila SB210]
MTIKIQFKIKKTIKNNLIKCIPQAPKIDQVFLQNCQTEENSSRNNTQKQKRRQRQSKIQFIYPEQEDQNEPTNEKINLRSQLINSNDVEIIEKQLQKKMQICQEQEKKITSHLKNYKIDESNLPVSIEENQAISDSLMRLLKTKFGKNQQKITTTDWRYNSSLIFTQENDMSYSPENKKQQQILAARQRKDIIALKQKINIKQSAASSQLSSPTESRKRFSSSINYDDKAIQTSKDQEIQNILHQIKEYNQKKFVNQIQQGDEIEVDKNSLLTKNFNKYNFKELKNQTQFSDLNISQQNDYLCGDNSIYFDQNQSVQRPQTTQNKIKQIIPNKTCNIEWSISNHLKKQKQQEKQATLLEQDSIKKTYQINDDDKEQSMLESDERLPSKSFELKNKLSKVEICSQEKQSKFQIVNNDQANQEQSKYQNRTLQNNSDSDFQANQTVINNKKFMPYQTRRQTKFYQPFQSPTRPRRIVNIKVNFQGSSLKQKLNQSIQEQAKQSSQTNKQFIEQTSLNEKQSFQKDFSQQIKITSIKSLEKPHQLSQVELWDSRCYNSNKEFNQTFYQYNSPLQHQKILNKLTSNNQSI